MKYTINHKEKCTCIKNAIAALECYKQTTIDSLDKNGTEFWYTHDNANDYCPRHGRATVTIELDSMEEGWL